MSTVGVAPALQLSTKAVLSVSISSLCAACGCAGFYIQTFQVCGVTPHTAGSPTPRPSVSVSRPSRRTGLERTAALGTPGSLDGGASLSSVVSVGPGVMVPRLVRPTTGKFA